MKRIITTIVAVGLAMLEINAQDKEMQMNTSKNRFSMDIAGFRIGLGAKDENIKVDTCSAKGCCSAKRCCSPEERSKIEFSLVGPFYFGWSCLTNDNYYGEWAGKGDFLRPRHCFTFGLSFCSISAALSENIRMSFGVRWSSTNYIFGTPVVLEDNEHGRTMPWFPVIEDNNKRNCKMYHSYMGVPLGLSYVNDKFALTFRVSAEGLLVGYSEWEKENVKHYFSALNKFKSRAELMASYNHIGAFVSYDLTPMFVPGSGNDCHLLTFGFAVCL